MVAAGRSVDHDEIRVGTHPVQLRVVDLRRHSAGDPCPLALDLPPGYGRVALVSPHRAAAAADVGADRPSGRLSPTAMAERARRASRQPRADAGRYQPEHGPPRPRHARRTHGTDAVATGGLRAGRYRVPRPPAEEAPCHRRALQQRLGEGSPRGPAHGGSTAIARTTRIRVPGSPRGPARGGSAAERSRQRRYGKERAVR